LSAKKKDLSAKKKYLSAKKNAVQKEMMGEWRIKDENNKKKLVEKNITQKVQIHSIFLGIWS
jgi:hypothetical protein